MRAGLRILGFFGLIVLSRAASAQVVDGEPATLEDARRAFDDASKAFAATGTDCVVMCRALQSMARAAERLCALAPPDDATAKQRCEEARAKVADATKKVLAACPGCNPSPGGAADEAATKPSVTTVEKAPPPTENETVALGGTTAFEAARISSARSFTVAASPLSLFTPAFLVEGHLEAYVGGPLSLLVRGGVGRMRVSRGSSGSPDTTSAWRVGGALRAYMAGPFAGAFFGLEGDYDHAENPVGASHFVPGFTFGPVVGFKHVAANGFTVETQLGVAAVAIDHRDDTDARPKVVPTWDIAVGYSF